MAKIRLPDCNWHTDYDGEYLNYSAPSIDEIIEFTEEETNAIKDVIYLNGSQYFRIDGRVGIEGYAIDFLLIDVNAAGDLELLSDFQIEELIVRTDDFTIEYDYKGFLYTLLETDYFAVEWTFDDQGLGLDIEIEDSMVFITNKSLTEAVPIKYNLFDRSVENASIVAIPERLNPTNGDRVSAFFYNVSNLKGDIVYRTYRSAPNVGQGTLPSNNFYQGYLEVTGLTNQGGNNTAVAGKVGLGDKFKIHSGEGLSPGAGCDFNIPYDRAPINITKHEPATTSGNNTLVWSSENYIKESNIVLEMRSFRSLELIDVKLNHDGGALIETPKEVNINSKLLPFGDSTNTFKVEFKVDPSKLESSPYIVEVEYTFKDLESDTIETVKKNLSYTVTGIPASTTVNILFKDENGEAIDILDDEFGVIYGLVGETTYSTAKKSFIARGTGLFNFILESLPEEYEAINPIISEPLEGGSKDIIFILKNSEEPTGDSPDDWFIIKDQKLGYR